MAPILFEGFLLYVAILLLTLFACVYLYFKYSYTYWKRVGVPYLEPTFPLGNHDTLIHNTFSHTLRSHIWHNEFRKRGLKFGGVWDLARKILVIVDPEYIRDVLAKDFQYFVDRDFFINEKDDPKRVHLFNVGSNNWKFIRQKMTPTFTTGKMKMMFNGVVGCSEGMVDFFKDAAEKGSDIELKKFLASFTLDVIGSCAYGIDTNSFREPEAKFRTMCFKIFQPDNIMRMKYSLIRNSPDLARMIGIVPNKSYITSFFESVVRNTIDFRKSKNLKRPDFLQLLIDLSETTKNDEKPFSFTDIVGNVFLFFVAGYDTSSTAMTFALYELARHQELQEKLRREILGILEKDDGKLTYENIQEMTYLRQVIDETLRLYPPVPILARICVKDYKLRDTNITIKKGIPVVISNFAIGRDPEYFPDPEKFDPDRFSPERKGSIVPYTYLPFGEGPRNCIGQRFGLMQSSIGLIQILRNFRITISPSTETPVDLNYKSYLLGTKQALYVKAEKL